MSRKNINSFLEMHVWIIRMKLRFHFAKTLGVFLVSKRKFQKVPRMIVWEREAMGDHR